MQVTSGEEVSVLESTKPTRIGDILMERGLISRSQLFQALDLQQARYLLSNGEPAEESSNEIGEILIELGFITREQLKKNLARQSRLRKTTLAFTLVAPLFTMACGGGGGAGANAPTSTNTGSNNVSSVLVVQSSSKSATPPQSPSSESSSSKPANSSASSKVQSSAQASSVGSSVKQNSSSIKNSAPSSKTASSASSVAVQGPVVLYWTAPSRRENGEVLDITELGGYEVRYKLRNKLDYKYIRIPGGFTDSYYFDYLKGDYQFEIAAVDVNGMYSNFVPINPVN